MESPLNFSKHIILLYDNIYYILSLYIYIYINDHQMKIKGKIQINERFVN